MYKLFFTIILICNYTVYTQNSRVEIPIMNCWFNALNDKGVKAKELIKTHENLLIKEGFLGEKSADGFVTMLKNIANNNALLIKPSQSFFSNINKIYDGEIIGYEECKKIVLADTLNFNAKKLNNFESKITDILNSDKFTRADVAQVMLSALEPDDFNFVYYELRAFMIFDLIILEEILPHD